MNTNLEFSEAEYKNFQDLWTLDMSLKVDRSDIYKPSLLCTLQMEWAYGSWLHKLLNMGCLYIFGI